MYTTAADAREMGATHYLRDLWSAENGDGLCVLLRDTTADRDADPDEYDDPWVCYICDSGLPPKWQPINQEGGGDSFCDHCGSAGVGSVDGIHPIGDDPILTHS